MTKSSDKAADFKAMINEIVNNSTATLTFPVSNQSKLRSKIENKLVDKITRLQLAREVIAGIPLGEMLYVKTELKVYADNNQRGWALKDTGLIITPIIFNSDSVRCILWAQQYDSWESRQIMAGRSESVRMVRFLDIRSYRAWEPKDAARTVNFHYQSQGYKRLAYGCE